MNCYIKFFFNVSFQFESIFSDSGAEAIVNVDDIFLQKIYEVFKTICFFCKT